MLSKLLSNIANSENASLPEGLSGNIESGDTGKDSQQVFRSLLKALQNDQSEDNKQLLRLDNSDKETEGEKNSAQLKGIGGIFTQVDTDEAVVNEQQNKQSILERLQQQLKKETSESEEQKVVESQSTEAKETPEGSLSDKENIVDSENNILPQKEQENFEVDEKNRVADDPPTQLKPANGNQQQSESSDGDEEVSEQLNEELNGETNNTESEDQLNSRQLAETSDDNKEYPSSSEHNDQAEDSKKKAGKAKVKATAESLSGNDFEAGREQKITNVSDSDEKNEGDRVQTGTTLNNSDGKVEVLTDDEGKTSSDSKQNQKVVVPQSAKEQNDPQKETDQKVDNRNGKESQQLSTDLKEQGGEKRTAFLNKNLQRSEGVSNKPREAPTTDTNNQKEQKQQSQNETIGVKSAKTELNDRQKKIFNSFFRNDNTAGLSDKGFEMKSAATEKDRRKTKENAESREKTGDIKKTRDQLMSRLGISNTGNSKQARSIDIQNIPGMSTGDSQMSTEEQKIWSEHSAENVEGEDEKEAQTSSSSSSARLGQMPVSNASLRQKMLPGLTQSVQKAAAEAKKNPGNWQKHNFVLDDGKKIQLSVRESKGVLQVKMGSINSDLSKLLQQNLQQIREHLKQEFNSDIDLQFESHDQGEEESAFSEGSKSSDQQRNYRNTVSGNEVATEGTGDVVSSTVRNFGYNQMEWTA